MKRKKVFLWVCTVLFLVLVASLTFFPNLWTKTSEEPTNAYVVPTTGINDPSHPDYDKIENGIHLRTGFAAGDGLQLVINNCTTCHSAKLVTQNRMSKARWQSTIRWMQETQNLWDLGTNEEAIVNYLATYYAPVEKGRRQNLSNIEWYSLEDQ